jgi:nucleoside-diphosphate-sugar epimerase
MNNTKILITGGMGYVGSRLTPHLLKLGHDVRVLDSMLYTDAGYQALRMHKSFEEWEHRFSLHRGDIRDPDTLQTATTDIDTIIHLAAISNDPTGEIDETLTRQVNFDAIASLLSIGRNNGVQRFINASSSSVFGLKQESDITEQLEPEPLTFYSKYKMLSEWLVVAAASEGFCTVNIRPATICGYSPRQRFDLTVNKLTADALCKGIITVHGGEQRRPNVGMTDMVHLYAQLTQIDPKLINGRTFNFGFENHKVIEIAKIIREELQDLNVEIKITETFDNRDYHISSDKIINCLNYKPVSSIRNEVANLRAAFAQNSFSDIDDAKHYNMKYMRMERDASTYQWLAR